MGKNMLHVENLGKKHSTREEIIYFEKQNNKTGRFEVQLKDTGSARDQTAKIKTLAHIKENKNIGLT